MDEKVFRDLGTAGYRLHGSCPAHFYLFVPFPCVHPSPPTLSSTTIQIHTHAHRHHEEEEEEEIFESRGEGSGEFELFLEIIGFVIIQGRSRHGRDFVSFIVRLREKMEMQFCIRLHSCGRSLAYHARAQHEEVPGCLRHQSHGQLATDKRDLSEFLERKRALPRQRPL